MWKAPLTAQKLRLYLGERDKAPGGGHLYDAILREARARGLAGATVLRGVAGFGAHSRLHTAKILRLSEDLPIVIEIIDLPEKIAAFLPWVEEHVVEGLVTLEECQVLLYRPLETA